MTLPTDADRQAGRAPLAFLVFLALMTSVIALTIDAVLPALDAIDADLGFASANDRQLMILLVFAGMGLSQVVFGALADSIGRKRSAMIGWGIYLAGSLIGLLAVSPSMILAARFLQGVGAGGPRIIAIAIVRDLFEGRAMARILSIVMTIFMVVPILAPTVGLGIEALGGWRAIFGLYLAMAVGTAAWYALGVPETLDPVHRRPLSVRPFARALVEIVSSRVAMGYTLGAMCVFGPFVTYIATAQQVLEELYGLGPLFPVAFGAVALAFAAASFLNARLVMRLGMRRLSVMALGALILEAGLATALLTGTEMAGVPPLWLFMVLMALIFFSVAIVFSNLNALALQPLGHIAGTASAVVMSITTLGAAAIALPIAGSFAGSLTPMFVGFLLLGVIGLALMWVAEKGR